MKEDYKKHPVDKWGEHFSEIEPLLNKFGTVTYSLRYETYIVTSNKKVIELVAEMYLNLANRQNNIEAIKKWNELLEFLEKISQKYACFIKLTHPRCIESIIADVRMGETKSSLFGKYKL